MRCSESHAGIGEARWRPLPRVVCAHPDRSLWSWLIDDASLTARLKARCTDFKVQVQRQAWSPATLSERRALGIAGRERCLVRQVHLLCNGVPVVFARTVIPVSTLRGRLRKLARLGTKPLGEMLFRCPDMQRGCLEIALLDKRRSLYAEAMAGDRQTAPSIWGRRAIFRLGGSPLLVSEFFLPALSDLSGLNRGRR